VAKHHAPLWQYFAPAPEPEESIAAPKGHGPPDSSAFSLQTRHFCGGREGAMIRFMDPS
jgi:hypothetical protein